MQPVFERLRGRRKDAGIQCRCLMISTLDENDDAEWHYIDGHLVASAHTEPGCADVYGCPDTDALWCEPSEPGQPFRRIAP
jgi:hypothetical protein